MGKFIGEGITDNINGKLFRITEDFMYITDKGDEILIPHGFICDLASIPRWAWIIVGHPAGEYQDAAVLHDYTLRICLVSSLHCDKLFREAMKALGVNGFKIFIMYHAVHILSKIAFNKYKKQGFKLDPRDYK